MHKKSLSNNFSIENIINRKHSLKLYIFRLYSVLITFSAILNVVVVELSLNICDSLLFFLKQTQILFLKICS